MRVLDWEIIVEGKRKKWRNGGRKEKKEGGSKGGREEEREGDLMQSLIYLNHVTRDVMTFYKVSEQSGNTG